MDQEWLTGWRTSVAATVTALMDTFQARFGFPPGANRLGPPATQQELTALRSLVPRPADDLTGFFHSVGQVSLPDVGNGYFIHPAGLVASRAAAGEPARLGPPHDIAILVFGSDGGGALYAVPAAAAGPVYRLRECGIENGTASGGDIQVVATDFADFLQRLKAAVETFTATGDLTDL